ncbi:hypothetical protein [Entomobacter blattae]|uniref:Uncharacterized protein n=1 Tax=Entomobacter blattae TaxID=2762277 RepID=A0A7H1NRA5_9PROT|nr:hypothetical protein [Entomobacter blattae]QNT78315.1 hypothetical protein JGUZn3_10870 [Entomobacter blattae]
MFLPMEFFPWSSIGFGKLTQSLCWVVGCMVPLALADRPVHAQTQLGGEYRECRLTIGKVVFCGLPFSGQAVIYRPGPKRVEQCSLSIGQVTFCKGPYNGKAIMQVHTPTKHYVMCEISIGVPIFCGEPFSGQWVLYARR